MEDLLTLFLTAASVSAVANYLVSRFARRGVEPTAAQLKAIEDEIGPALEEALARVPEPEEILRPTSGAEGAMKAIMRAYMQDLAAEASRIARRFGAESPSPRHVSQAASRIGILRSQASAATDALLGFGTLLIGAAASYQINLVTGGTPAPGWGVPMALVFGTGVGLAVTGVTLKAKSR